MPFWSDSSVDILYALQLDIYTYTFLFKTYRKPLIFPKNWTLFPPIIPKIDPFSTLKATDFIWKTDVLSDIYINFSIKNNFFLIILSNFLRDLILFVRSIFSENSYYFLNFHRNFSLVIYRQNRENYRIGQVQSFPEGGGHLCLFADLPPITPIGRN